jgi:hypothetical protein
MTAAAPSGVVTFLFTDVDRGFHVLKGKSAAVQVFGLDQETDAG